MQVCSLIDRGSSGSVHSMGTTGENGAGTAGNAAAASAVNGGRGSVRRRVMGSLSLSDIAALSSATRTRRSIGGGVSVARSHSGRDLTLLQQTNRFMPVAAAGSMATNGSSRQMLSSGAAHRSPTLELSPQLRQQASSSAPTSPQTSGSFAQQMSATLMQIANLAAGGPAVDVGRSVGNEGGILIMDNDGSDTFTGTWPVAYQAGRKIPSDSTRLPTPSAEAGKASAMSGISASPPASGDFSISPPDEPPVQPGGGQRSMLRNISGNSRGLVGTSKSRLSSVAV